MRLSDLSPGASGRIDRITGDGALTRRLLELGFVEGANVRVIRAAPFGGPIQVNLDRARFSIRRTEADVVVLAT